MDRDASDNHDDSRTGRGSMRKITIALLSGAYLCLALTIALLLWRSGAGWGAGVAALLGGLGLAFALHGIVDRGVEQSLIKADLTGLRDAHLLLAGQMEQIQNRLAILTETVQDETVRVSEELTSEVRMLEDLVQRISESLEERLSQPYVGVGGGHAEQHHQRSTALLHTIREALADNRVDLYLQPVVSLPQRRTVFYESFSRLRDETGRVMMPAEYLPAAEPEGLVSAIDNLLLFRCIQIVRRLAKQDRKVGIFCNISVNSLRDEAFFPQFLEFLSENKDMAGALIFELGQAAFEQRGSAEARNMAKLADLGFRFSLDKVTNLDIDFQDLARSDVKFVKIAAQTVISELMEYDGKLVLSSMKDIEAADYCALTRRYGVEVIAEKIESERQVVDVLEMDVGYGQGHLFGEPRAIKESVLAEADPPAEFVRSTLRPRRAAGGGGLF
jgi:cyclic-di-GMP phosphodiesterase TipF (flagellum assembly factor)